MKSINDAQLPSEEAKEAYEVSFGSEEDVRPCSECSRLSESERTALNTSHFHTISKNGDVDNLALLASIRIREAGESAQAKRRCEERAEQVIAAADASAKAACSDNGERQAR